MPNVTITAPNGDAWTVEYRTGVQRKRTGLGNASGGDASRYVQGILASYADADGTVRCAVPACGAVLGVGRAVTATLADGRTTFLPAAEGDRVVADLPGWTAVPAVPYSPATVLPVCPVHNGDASARADHHRALADVARDALDRHARPT
jgi:hypothetical protein